MRPVIVGQQPASEADEGVSLPIRPGTSGSRLLGMMNLSQEEFERDFIRINVSPAYDPDGFTPSYHRHHVTNLLPLLEGRKVCLLGPAVADAFGLRRSSYDYCHFFDHPGEWHILLVVIPHPSGLNRLYNDPSMIKRVREVLFYLWETR